MGQVAGAEADVSAKFFAASDQGIAIRVRLFKGCLDLLQCLFALLLGGVARRRLHLHSGRPLDKLPIGSCGRCPTSSYGGGDTNRGNYAWSHAPLADPRKT